ncbi:hypothetical protein [Nocardia cyriacigeorgica]|uniref:hypothetical protein n=1 Tax=Nocardia cyriacigeorgica TaxID=135487 RepID=UPI002458188D|nr:hypothetical protein [Nocardia cyriacigeorgica]
MTTTETETTTTEAEAHRAELAAATTHAARVRYARRALGPEAGAPQVRDWLAGHGYNIGKSTVYANLSAKAASATDTAELPRLTSEQLAELDTALAGSGEPASTTEETPAAPAAPEVAESGPVAPIAAPVQSDSEPESAAGQIPVRSDSSPIPESDPVGFQSDSSPAESDSGPDSSPARADSNPDSSPIPESSPIGFQSDSGVQSEPDSSPESGPESGLAESDARARLVVWPVMLMALAAFVTIWSGWVGLGEMTGFGMVQPLPGISGFQLNTAITLPIGVEAYASYALYVWLSGRASATTARFAQWSAFGALTLGAAGQVAYHLMAANGMKVAPWWITTFVSTLPVIVVGMGAALAHMVIRDRK